MATCRERFWSSRKRARKAWAVTFVNKNGKRQQATFSTEQAGMHFLSEVLPREELWRAMRKVQQLDKAGK